VQSLVDLKLLAEVKMGSSLVKLELLLEEGMIESLVKLKFLLEKEMVEPLVNLDSKHAEGKNLHRLIHQCFFCKYQIKGKCQCK
jgi:hypothetical protein